MDGLYFETMRLVKPLRVGTMMAEGLTASVAMAARLPMMSAMGCPLLGLLHVPEGRPRLDYAAYALHDAYRLYWVGTHRRLLAQHYRVCAVEYGVGDVARLGAGGARVLDHRLQHLSRDDDGLTRLVALGDYLLLEEGDVPGRNLDAEVAARYHDAVALVDDLIYVGYRFPMLNLANDRLITVSGAYCLLDGLDVFPVPDERGGEPVCSRLYAELYAF